MEFTFPIDVDKICTGLAERIEREPSQVRLSKMLFFFDKAALGLDIAVHYPEHQEKRYRVLHIRRVIPFTLIESVQKDPEVMHDILAELEAGARSGLDSLPRSP